MKAKRIRSMVVPVLLAAATAAAAAGWFFAAVHFPAALRRTLDEGLREYFPGGVKFRSASRIGNRFYRVLDFEAFPPGSDRPWFTAAALELRQSPDGKRIELVRLGSPVLRLGPGPALLPDGALRLPEGEGALPELEAFGGAVFALLPGQGRLPVPLATSLSLRFRPGPGLEGSFQSPVGAFRLQGSIDPRARSSLQANADKVEIPPDSPLRGIVALDARGKASASVRLAFGGAEPPVLTGSLSMQELDLGAAGVRFSEVRVALQGREGPGGFGLEAELHAARASAGGLTAEGVVLRLPGLSPESLSGEAVLWKGRLRFRGAAMPWVRLEGSVEGADLSEMPPGFLGAATPAGGAMDARFTLEGEALEGAFEARDAKLWSVPLFSGMRRLVPGLGKQEGMFRAAKGRFRTVRGETILPSLDLEGSGFLLTLAKPGHVGPERRLELEFELQLQRDERGEAGLPPLRTLVDAVGRALWKPIGKYFLFRVRIGGTLDAPTHELVAPLGLGK